MTSFSDIPIKDVVFFGNFFNNIVVGVMNKIIPMSSTQNSILLSITYLVLIYLIITFAQSMKPIIKWAIIGLLILLIVGFFKI